MGAAVVCFASIAILTGLVGLRIVNLHHDARQELNATPCDEHERRS